VRARELLGRGAGQMSYARAGGWLGRAEDSTQKLNLNKKTFFFFKTVL
jgi:hypothetical protein